MMPGELDVSGTGREGVFPFVGAEGTGGGSSWSTMLPSNTLLLLGFAFIVGTGGVVAPSEAPTYQTGSQVWIEGTCESDGCATTFDSPAREEVSPEQRIGAIRANLSLNHSQVAEAMRVQRPTVYGWLKGTAPRGAQQIRLKQLYDIAALWRTLSDGPVGKNVIAPVLDGQSLAGLLREPSLNIPKIKKVLEIFAIANNIVAERKRASGYKSVASVMQSRGLKPPSDETRQDRLDDAIG